MKRADSFDIVVDTTAFMIFGGEGTANEIAAHLGYSDDSVRRALRALHGKKIIRIIGLYSPRTGCKCPIYALQSIIPEPDVNRITRKTQCTILSKPNSPVPHHLFN